MPNNIFAQIQDATDKLNRFLALRSNLVEEYMPRSSERLSRLNHRIGEANKHLFERSYRLQYGLPEPDGKPDAAKFYYIRGSTDPIQSCVKKRGELMFMRQALEFRMMHALNSCDENIFISANALEKMAASNMNNIFHTGEMIFLAVRILYARINLMILDQKMHAEDDTLYEQPLADIEILIQLSSKELEHPFHISACVKLAEFLGLSTLECKLRELVHCEQKIGSP